jgi:putative nucleotidyltransferase with HDIG domain
VGGVIAAGAVLTMLGLIQGLQLDLPAIGLFSGLAVITQLLQTKNLYGKSSVSVSMAVNFAAALFTGFPGVACVSAAIVLTHYFQRRPTLYKTIFNWATHVLASSAPMLAMGVLAIPLQLSNLLLLALPIAVSALVFYAIETGLIATAISLAEEMSLMTTWRERYRWLAGHYLVLCIMGLFLAVAYSALGTLGLIVFTLPVLMMAYVQRQYVERTEDSVQELQRMYEELASANSEVVEASRAIRQLNDELFITLAKIIDARDPYVAGHAAKVAEYATAIAVEMDLPAERVERVRQAAFLHDIGKIAISEQILHKPGELTDEEYEYFKTHANMGAEFLETSRGLRHLVPFVRHHHERWDGIGYPDGLRGEQIPLEARILAVSDAIEAMASDRPYRRASSIGQIVAELRRCAGTQFASAVVDAFIRVAEREGDYLVINSAREVWRDQVENGRPMPYINMEFAFQESGVGHPTPQIGRQRQAELVGVHERV